MPSFKMKFSGVTILQGVEFSIFPIDFEWALQQCSATALPVIRNSVVTVFCNQTPKVWERIHLLQLLILNEYAARYAVARHCLSLVDIDE